MTTPCPSSCGVGAGGGLSVDVLSATAFAVGSDDWGLRPMLAVDGTGGR
jgi:hypothetical protein